MKQNLYFKFVYQYKGIKPSVSLGFIFLLLSLPKSFLEVFIRKNMGVRHYERAVTIINSIILTYLGYRMATIWGAILYWVKADNIYPWNYEGYHWEMVLRPMPLNQLSDYIVFAWPHLLLHMATWFILIIGLLVAGWKRRMEINHLPSVFDMARTSVYTGDIHPFFLKFKWKNKELDVRQIETILEPLFFLVLGIVLLLLLQPVGFVLIFSSWAYRLNQKIQYKLGDRFIMDTIDNQLFNEEKINAFVNDDRNNERGVRYYGRKPTDPELRRKLADDFTTEEIAVAK